MLCVVRKTTKTKLFSSDTCQNSIEFYEEYVKLNNLQVSRKSCISKSVVLNNYFALNIILVNLSRKHLRTKFLHSENVLFMKNCSIGEKEDYLYDTILAHTINVQKGSYSINSRYLLHKLKLRVACGIVENFPSTRTAQKTKLPSLS